MSTPWGQELCFVLSSYPEGLAQALAYIMHVIHVCWVTDSFYKNYL